MKFGCQLSLGRLNIIKLSRVCVKPDGLARHNILESIANIDQVKGICTTILRMKQAITMLLLKTPTHLVPRLINIDNTRGKPTTQP